MRVPMGRYALATRVNQIKMLSEDPTIDEDTRAKLNALVANVEELLGKPHNLQTRKASGAQTVQEF
jgi:hypothetical protein